MYRKRRRYGYGRRRYSRRSRTNYGRTNGYKRAIRRPSAPAPSTWYGKVGAFAGKWIPRIGKLASTVGKIASIINSEAKYSDKLINDNTYGTGNLWSIHSLIDIAQGTTQITRDGMSIKVKSIDIRGYLRCDHAVGQARFNSMRYVIFWHADTRATIPLAAEIWDNTGSIHPFNQFRKLEYVTPTVEILAEERLVAPYLPWFVDQKILIPIDLHLELKRHMRFRGTGATEGDKTCGLYLAICGLGDNTNQNPVVTLNCRTRYYDN